MEGELQRVVGRNLRRHRLRLGFSQEAFAELMGVHRTYFSSVERGERNLTLQTLERIANFLEVDPRSLLDE
ncbi:HTH-type transcriptional regulator SinR [Mycobacterium sp. THAF192]|nr:HTH-type transcriptional regulator SinR [Mycobacterium sp. THAF192]